MSTRRVSAAEARKSIDTRASDEDIEMKDSIEEVHSDADADGEPNDEGAVGHDILQIIHDIATYLCNVEEEYASTIPQPMLLPCTDSNNSGEELAAGFQRIPNRRVLPDYFDVISEPIAFSTIRVRRSAAPTGNGIPVRPANCCCHREKSRRSSTIRSPSLSKTSRRSVTTRRCTIDHRLLFLERQRHSENFLQKNCGS